MGAALAASDHEGVIATCRSMLAPWAIERAERARQHQGEGGIAGGEEDGDELAGTPSSAVLGPFRRSCTMTDSVR